jgi:hypothetical protein
MVAYPLTTKITSLVMGLITDPLLKRALALCYIDDEFLYVPENSIADGNLIEMLSSSGKLKRVS